MSLDTREQAFDRAVAWMREDLKNRFWLEVKDTALDAPSNWWTVYCIAGTVGNRHIAEQYFPFETEEA